MPKSRTLTVALSQFLTEFSWNQGVSTPILKCSGQKPSPPLYALSIRKAPIAPRLVF